MTKEEFLKYLYKYWKIIIAISVIIFIIFFYSSYNNKVVQLKKKAIESNMIANTKEEKKEVAKEYFYVDIKGAVVNPNVYKVVDGSRIIDVINMAGGLKEGADTSVLNLSKKVNDEMLIIIYTAAEISEIKEGKKTITEVIKYIEKECFCPDPEINGACNNQGETKDNSQKININTATLQELMTLSGIGESKAQSIIDYRLSNGNFTSIDDIKNVTGIGESLFDKIKNNLTI
ncbi:MAG TPA: hypothetical protein GXZ95_02890 [Mollicutes bacterium]|nr:hypothetical protein [Mollicutes bacterium]